MGREQVMGKADDPHQGGKTGGKNTTQREGVTPLTRELAVVDGCG